MSPPVLALVSVAAALLPAAALDATSPDNSTLILVAVIAAVPGTLAALIAFLTYMQTRANHAATKEIASSVNGMKTDLVAASIGKATAEGHLAGEQAQRDRQAAPESSSGGTT